MKTKYQVFVSYRRDGGEYTARIIRDKLSQLGYRVFFDVESLRSGDFNTELYKVIEECQDFLLVLSPGALDRCEKEDDWVRQEVVHALQQGKNIVPVMLRNFQFPEHMPEEIEPLRFKNGLPADAQFFDAFIKKLEEFLQSKPYRVVRWKKRMPIVIVAALTAIAVSATAAWNHSGLFPYPRTAAEKNLTGNLLAYIEGNLVQIELMAECMNQMYDACDRQLTFGDADPERFSTTLRQYRRVLYQMDLEDGMLSPDLQSALQDSPFSAADAEALYNLKLMFHEGFLDDTYFLESLINNELFLEKSDRKEVLDNYRDMLEEQLEVLACGANMLLLPVNNKSALEDFKQAFLPQLRYIPLTASDWSDDKEELDSKESNCFENMNKLTNSISVLVGESNMQTMREKAQYIELLLENGYTVAEAEQAANEVMAQADRVAEKSITLQEKIRQLEESEERLAQIQAEMKVKFAPADGDDGGVLWGKMLRFLNVGMYDDALICVDAYRETMRNEDENAVQCSAAAARFIRSIGDTGIDYGVMIINFEVGETEGDPRKIGDVIIAVEGRPCHNWEEYAQLTEALTEADSYTIVVLRDPGDGSGILEQVQLEVPTGIQGIYMYNMTEKKYE